MSTHNNKPTLTESDIDNCTNLVEAMALVRKCGLTIPNNIGHQNDIKRLLRRELRKNQPLTKAELDIATAARQEDAFNRNILRGNYLRTRSYIKEELPEPFQNDLEQCSPQYETRLQNSIDDLQTSQCILLFAGEVGAGKSSLINLFLGVKIMPTSGLQCTAAIVEISYGSAPQVTAHYRDDSSGKSFRTICEKMGASNNADTFLDKVHTMITERDDETGESPYEKIQLEWPIEMLQGGVTIVDSPGVGGKNGVSQMLSSYLKKPFGFIYVIDSTTSINKHRLGELLLKAIEANNGFDHGTTIFVCNHWDKVSPGDTERVKNATRSRLSMVLPMSKKLQLYPISVTETAMDVKSGIIQKDYQQLLEGIRKFLPQTMKGKLRIYYRFLSNLHQRILYSLRISFNINKEKAEENRKRYIEVETRIGILRRNPRERLNRIKSEVTKASYDAGVKILTYLNSMQDRERLARWSNGNCPNREKTWQNVLKNANAKIADRVAEKINSWQKETDFVKFVETSIIQHFKEQFQLIDKQLEALQDALLDGRETRKFAEAKARDAKTKQTKQQKIATESKDGFLSIGIAVTSFFHLDHKDPMVKDLFRNRYATNPNQAMEEATRIYLSMMDNVSLAVAVSKYFDRLLKGIDKVGSMVPAIVKADQKLLDQLNGELQKDSTKLVTLPHMADRCAILQRELDLFYAQRLIVPDFSMDQITLGQLRGTGTFANVYEGTLRQGLVDLQVAVKEPKDELRTRDVTDVLLEESMLRDLQHKHIVKYYGMCRSGTDNNLRLTFIMEYCPFTLKDKCVEVGNSPSSLGRTPDRQREVIQNLTKYLIQISSGLTYLHNISIVHRDLKPENVLLNVKDDVKIADLGLAKKVKDASTCTGTPMFMAPEVLLLGDKYDTKADIYSFAMIMWELWYGKDVSHYAAIEIQGSLKNAMESKWRPSLSIVHSPSSNWKEIILQCWQQDPKQRPTAVEIENKLVQYHQELQD